MTDATANVNVPQYGKIKVIDAVRKAVELTREHLITIVAALLIGIVAALFTGGFLLAAFMLAMSKLAIRIVDGEENVQSNDVLVGIKELVVPGFLLSILPLIGVAACVGGVFVMIPVMVFATFLRADHPELSESDLLKQSWTAISNAGLCKWLFLQIVLLPLVALTGILGCGIGMFATTGLAVMINACIYRQVFPRTQATAA